MQKEMTYMSRYREGQKGEQGVEKEGDHAAVVIDEELGEFGDATFEISVHKADDGHSPR